MQRSFLQLSLISELMVRLGQSPWCAAALCRIQCRWRTTIICRYRYHVHLEADLNAGCPVYALELMRDGHMQVPRFQESVPSFYIVLKAEVVVLCQL